MKKTKLNEKRPLYLLAEIASILRGENGCAWDKEQTSGSLKPYLIEEAYEVYDAIDSGEVAGLREELGDLLYQVYAHAQIAKEKNLFTIDDVAQDISDKLVKRHPHVFGGEKVSSAAEVIDRWEKIKKNEKSHRESILDGVPVHLPSLLKAYRIQQKVSRIGFDWERVDDAAKKLDEEITEFKAAISSGKKDSILEEAGDLLFSVVNVLRMIGINAEEALMKANEKFIKRFKYMERRTAERGIKLEDMTLAGLDSLWEESKKSGG